MLTDIRMIELPDLDRYAYNSGVYILPNSIYDESYFKIGCDIYLDGIPQPILIIHKESGPHIEFEHYYLSNKRSLDAIHLLSIVRIPCLDYIVLHAPSILELLALCNRYNTSQPSMVISWSELLANNLYWNYASDEPWLYVPDNDTYNDRIKYWYTIKDTIKMIHTQSSNPFRIAYSITEINPNNSEMDVYKTNYRILNKLLKLIHKYKPNQLYYLLTLGEPYSIDRGKPRIFKNISNNHRSVLFDTLINDAHIVSIMYHLFLLPRNTELIYTKGSKLQVIVPYMASRTNIVSKMNLYINILEQLMYNLSCKYGYDTYRIWIDESAIGHVHINYGGKLLSYQTYMVPLLLISYAEIVLM